MRIEVRLAQKRRSIRVDALFLRRYIHSAIAIGKSARTASRFFKKPPGIGQEGEAQ